MEHKITYIKLGNLYPHPKNPRKDLGDLTELTESIKVKGLLQNLTVVPKAEGEGNYTVIIGHRRCAAAKLAGLDVVPCVITEMSEKTQVAVMMAENVQRSDLTVYEQAQGIQMMMDLGMTAEDISAETGFSASTVRRRVKLLDLDADKFKSAEQRGATLMDFAELEKVKDIKERNKLLDVIGTNNFDYCLRRAIDAQNRAERNQKFEEALSEFAEKTDNPAGLRLIADIYNQEKLDEALSEKSDDYKYWYKPADGYTPIRLYREYTEAELAEKAETQAAENKERDERREHSSGLREVSRIAYELRHDAIYAISNSQAKKHITDIMTFLFETAMSKAGNWNNEFLDFENIFDICGIADGDINDADELDGDELIAAIKPRVEAVISNTPEQALLRAAYEYFDDGEGKRYYNSFCATHEANADLARLYEFLQKLGYVMSDDERALQDGTHELFLTED